VCVCVCVCVRERESVYIVPRNLCLVPCKFINLCKREKEREKRRERQRDRDRDRDSEREFDLFTMYGMSNLSCSQQCSQQSSQNKVYIKPSTLPYSKCCQEYYQRAYHVNSIVCVAVCCNVVQFVSTAELIKRAASHMLQCVTVCCSVLHCVIIPGLIK